MAFLNQGKSKKEKGKSKKKFFLPFLTAMKAESPRAIMILNKGLKSTVGHTESKACGQNNLCLGGETPSSKLAG
ncbi:MAG: hypothetical protein ACHBN1_35580 [Heteroscytonema crispum UTEX LB 1556]